MPYATRALSRRSRRVSRPWPTWGLPGFALRATVALVLGLAGPSSSFAQALSAQEELFNRPATMSPRASASVLLSVASAGQRFVAVGEAGYIVLSDDDGRTWRQARVPVAVALTKVYFASAQNGWAVGHGGVVLHSKNGGETWTKQLDGLQIIQLELNAVGADQDSATRKSRLEDSKRLAADGPDKPLFDVYFDEGGRGFIVGAYGLAFSSMDGGQTWTSLRSRIPNPKGKHLYAIHVSGPDVFLVGEQGALYRLQAADMLCTELHSSYAGTYFGIVEDRNGGILVYGLRGNAFRTRDHGKSWTKIATDQPVTLTAGARAKNGSVFLADETGRILRYEESSGSFKPLPIARPMSVTGVVESADGALIVSGSQGVARIALETNHPEKKE